VSISSVPNLTPPWLYAELIYGCFMDPIQSVARRRLDQLHLRAGALSRMLAVSLNTLVWNVYISETLLVRRDK
jgi:hypothetical protein